MAKGALEIPSGRREVSVMGVVTTFPKQGQKGFQRKERDVYEAVSEYRDYVEAVIRLRNGPNIDHLQRIRSLGNAAVRAAAECINLMEYEDDDGK